MTVWGSGTPRREFLHVDDLADCCTFLMDLPDARFRALTRDLHPTIVNIGVGEDLAIRELAELVREVVGFAGELVFDTAMPDGTPRKLLEVSRVRELGWQARIPLREGIAMTYRWYLESADPPPLKPPAPLLSPRHPQLSSRSAATAANDSTKIKR